jgi:hypothetical protein
MGMELIIISLIPLLYYNYKFPMTYGLLFA